MKFWLVFLVAIGCYSFNTSAQSFSFYITPNGNDAATGTSMQQAVATFQKARDLVRLHKQQHPDDTVYVYFSSGEYVLAKPVTFGPEDGEQKRLRLFIVPYPAIK